MTVRIIVGDCRETLRQLPDESVHCVVTSPPYWGLRSYGVGTENGEIGLEATLEKYLATMVEIFREVRRVLRDDGMLWLNMGDSYAGSSISGGDQTKRVGGGTKMLQRLNHNVKGLSVPVGLKPKDLCGIPWRLALALQADGWWLRSDIIWAKPNPMPESVTDRPTKAHEYVFLLAKRSRYYYDADAVREPHKEPWRGKGESDRQNWNTGGLIGRGHTGEYIDGIRQYNPAGRNRRTVWTIPTAPFSQAHFATFPPALVEPCIKAGTSERGVCGACGKGYVRVVETYYQPVKYPGGVETPVGKPIKKHNQEPKASSPEFAHSPQAQRLGRARRIDTTTGWQPACTCDAGDPIHATCLDPFGGAGTVGLVADRLGRDAILLELNPEYAEMSRRRIIGDAGMFADVVIE